VFRCTQNIVVVVNEQINIGVSTKIPTLEESSPIRKIPSRPIYISKKYFEMFENGEVDSLFNAMIQQFGEDELKKIGIKDKSVLNFFRSHVDINKVDGDKLNIEEFRRWKVEDSNALFLLEEDNYICGSAIEKMSKSYFNVVNPDQIIENYGADTLRMYEMFLGPLEQSKPWNTNGIDGVYKFLRRFWNLVPRPNG
jgi:leucyl-tRNA synthetase